jgi:beta-N-acetylhexosaminidase
LYFELQLAQYFIALFIVFQIAVLVKIFQHILLIASLSLLLHASSHSQQPCFMNAPTPWADSLLQTLTLDQKIGQLFMIAAWSSPTHKDFNQANVQKLIDQYGVGGIIFMQGSPGRQVALTNKYQNSSQIPLLIAMDAEWGLGMRLDSTISYPRQMTMGASGNDSLIYAFGLEMARQLKRVGAHVSFSPVVDINNNPKNPVISNRSFGEEKELVARYSEMYMKGLQDGGILACAKHFPGHGDTEVDSHKDLPVIQHDRMRLDSVELYPYKYLIQRGLGSVMTAHLFVPALDTTPNTATTLSRPVINDLLRDQLHFNGLVFTDALNMHGVTKYYDPGEAELMALAAGNDMLLFSQNVPLAIEKIKEAIDSGWINLRELDEHVLRILRTKEWAGLHKPATIETGGIYADLNNVQAKNLQRELIESAVTVVRNANDLLPINPAKFQHIAVVSVGVDQKGAFANGLEHYTGFDHFIMEKNPDIKRSMWLNDTLSKYDLVIAGMLNTSNRQSKNFGVTNECARILNSIGGKTNVVLSVFANPYALELLRDLSQIESVVVSYQDDDISQAVTAEAIMGAADFAGELPVTCGPHFAQGLGEEHTGSGKMRWMSPTQLALDYQKDLAAQLLDTTMSAGPAGDYEEDMMLDAVKNQSSMMESGFKRIDDIAQSGITLGAYPGCRILVAKNGNVVYDKAFGTVDWKAKQKVDLQTVYDLASITKVAGSTIAAMRLVDMGLLDVNKTLGEYLNIPADNEYSKICIKNMLSHCAGLTAWIPFYQNTMSNGERKSSVYTSKADASHQSEVAQGIYILDSYRDSIFKTIISTPLSADKSYKYSDLGYYFMQRIVEKQSGKSLDAFLNQEFYEPMGLTTMGYNPLKRFDKERIAPTELDQVFRKQQVHGHVHDQGAAMMGGIAGHAGLFSNAQDLAVVMQMLMDSGQYNGKQYLTKATIDLFNKRYFDGNRRGLGFDKPSLSPGHGSTCREADASSFGHTGFTGTMCWADPSKGLVYIFLSNRVNTDAENKKLQDLNIRTEIQKEIYRVLAPAK